MPERLPLYLDDHENLSLEGVMDKQNRYTR